MYVGYLLLTMDEKIVYPSREKIIELKEKYGIVAEEIEEFNKLIKGHEKLLVAIGKL